MSFSLANLLPVYQHTVKRPAASLLAAKGESYAEKSVSLNRRPEVEENFERSVAGSKLLRCRLTPTVKADLRAGIVREKASSLFFF